MSSVDQQIAENRAKKKKVIITGVIASVFACLLIGVVVTLLAYFPVSGNTPVVAEKQEKSEPQISSANQAIDRKALQTALNETNQRVSELVATPYISTWQPAKVEAFQADIDQAFNDYGASNYSQAQTTIEQLNTDITEYQSAFEKAYRQPYADAAKAIAADDIMMPLS